MRKSQYVSMALIGAIALVAGMLSVATAAHAQDNQAGGALTQHKLPELPYAYDALEPYIDAKTMELHHSKHHAAYVSGLNKAEAELAKARAANDYALVQHWSRQAAFHGGGHYLHSMFWTIMAPPGKGGGGKPTGALAAAIAATALVAQATLPIVSGDGFDTELVTTVPGPELANDVYFSTHTYREDTRPEVLEFIEAYQAEYCRPPENAFAALGFDAVGMIVDAMERAGSAEGEALRDALAVTKGYKAVTGEITYSRPTGVPVKGVSIISVKNGQYKVEEVWMPEVE